MNITIVIVCIFAIITAVVIYLRKLIKKQAEKLSYNLEHLDTYHLKSSFERAKDDTAILNNHTFSDIPSEINLSHPNTIITSSQEIEFIASYSPYHHEASSTIRKLNVFNITPSPAISKFIYDYGRIREIIKQHNADVYDSILCKHKEFFDNCLKYPLDRQQRRSIISEEDNCLVVSSAGSGKTSSIIGKVKYLTEIKDINPSKILLISYTNKAAAELTERLDTNGLKGYTFHKLALDIIAKANGVKPVICDNTDALFIEIYHNLIKQRKFQRDIVEYFADYNYEMDQQEKMKYEKRQELTDKKSNRYKSLFPDMDGKAIYVRSEQEQKICFALYSLGVKFRYEEEYEYPLADEMYAQYRPDFSIYYEAEGKTSRIYLEHFGIDEHGLVPLWFAKDNNISYEEANKKYNDGISWKKAAHKKFGTKLITTTSADFKYSDIRSKLSSLLTENGVPIFEQSDEDLYNSVLPNKSKNEKVFIRLIVTFTTLLKSSCQTLDEVLRRAKRADDSRSYFIINHIFRPVYESYSKLLKERGQIDFTDAILQATQICNNSHPVDYDYIIVDEFQDISIDRYNFLKALRRGSTPAKLYCVGDDWQSIYRFSGSDMALFNKFSDFFGSTEINKIETTYRFGEPLVSLSSKFIQRNKSQIHKDIHPFNNNTKTHLEFHCYDKYNYHTKIEKLISTIPTDKNIFLLGRYSFDDYYLSLKYQSIRDSKKFFYIISGRKIEFLTVHKSKGLEADYVILLQCNKDIYGFPSLISDDPVLNYVLTESDDFAFAEERRLFYVAITRAKIKTIVLYDSSSPSVFVNEFLKPSETSPASYTAHPNANKRWTKKADSYLLTLHNQGKSIKYIAEKMGRSQTSIVMRINKLKQ